MIFRRSDLSLKSDATSRFLPWIVGVMVLLATLALAAAMLAGGLRTRWSSDLAGEATVQILPDPSGTGTDEAARLAQALALVEGAPGIEKAHALSRAEVTALVSPWLGNETLPNDIALPGLIALKLAPDGGADLPALANRLAAAVPGARLDDHKVWLGGLVAFSDAISLLALILVGLIAGAGCLTVVFVSRSALAVHHQAVEILSLIGARDAYIARQIETHVLRLALLGAAVGLAGGILILAALALLFHANTANLLPRFGIGAWRWALLGLSVPVAGGLALMSARITLLRALARGL